MSDSRRSGALVISLDFELHWGVRDHTPTGSPYDGSLFGAREAIPRTLRLFEEFGVAATWATVGLLFARDRAEAERYRPAVVPAYEDPRLYPYDQAVGEDEASDPLHYAPSLVKRIVGTPRQEVGTHTFSHFFCNEAGESVEAFAADLAAAGAIARSWGIDLRSIVFPRNQVNARYADVLREAGIAAFRGNPPSWMWRFSDREQSAGRLKRAARMADAYVGISGDSSFEWGEVIQPSGLADVRASHFVRPFNPRLRHLEPLRVGRMRRTVRDAAHNGRLLHLWWHPHNFGRHTDECLAFLRQVLEEFASCRKEYGMESLTMAEVAGRAEMMMSRAAASRPAAAVSG